MITAAQLNHWFTFHSPAESAAALTYEKVDLAVLDDERHETALSLMRLSHDARVVKAEALSATS